MNFHVRMDAIKLSAPEGADPNGDQAKLLLNNDLARRLGAAHAAAQRSVEAFCPAFGHEAEQQHGGLCTGEGC
ncbi:MAG TPA: hypothetical protein VLV87_07960 [Gammaproteobacteria bacterium]|nr:hypothetical protein [Gammaproteobacteria bacterium]